MISKWINENGFLKSGCFCGGGNVRYAKGDIKFVFKHSHLFRNMEVYKSGKKIEFEDFEQVKEWYASNI